MAKQTFMGRVKAYRKLHPRCSQVDAMKKLKGTTVSGTKKKRKATVIRKITGAAKKPVTIKKTVSVSRKVGTIGSVKQGEKLLREIDRLEKKRKAIKNKELRDIVQLEINARHDKLKQIKRSFRRSA